mgnify:CR=1 FL=1
MSENKTAVSAILYSAKAPSPEQERRFCDFIASKYGENIPLVWESSDKYKNGFRLEIGSDVYDWSIDGRFEQLKQMIMDTAKSKDSIPLIRENLRSWTPKVLAQQVGTVLTVGDGIATVSGLEHATYGEILLFEGGVRGMVQNLSETEAGCILFDDDGSVGSSSKVVRTGKRAGIPVGEAFIGRVINSLGMPIDGNGEIAASEYFPIERPAPAIIDRQPVNVPLKTGIMAIDSMFPIGRGQRELIIGDRQTGKTSIAVDTILNQKGKDVICVYVSIGQKSSSVANLVRTLKEKGAMDYTVVLHASASDTAPMQYIAPYAGTSIGEYFMDKGKDVLIIYDDLSKHAVAYRTISLLLGRSPGREAYPGDVFYLHSRLLERSAHLSDAKGGGSMTALPIVETQAGDVSAYIPTNIISITDGQIFLESELFFAGQRPAVNVGLSVSRVGGDAQTKAMKSAAGTLRLELAQYREMKTFTQFASDLDEETKKQLEFGQGLMQILRQGQGEARAQYEQVIILVAVLSKTLTHIDAYEMNNFVSGMLDYFRKNYAALCDRIEKTGVLSADDRASIIEIAGKFAETYEGSEAGR